MVLVVQVDLGYPVAAGPFSADPFWGSRIGRLRT